MVISLFVIALVVLQAARLFFAFNAHQATFTAYQQPKKIRYMLGLLVPPAVLAGTAPVLLGLVLSYLISFACVLFVWHHAHRQYHFFDAKGTAKVKPAQSWLSSVEMLALLVGAFVLFNLLLTPVVVII